ncbi:MAG: cell wall hydrolase [Oscillospiraceae bacterium]|nr:cell wall hydrolase [Oscillospiraceae bacterium]
MKRVRCLFLSLALMMGLILTANGAESIPTAAATLDGEPMDVTAYLYDGTSYFPLEETVKAFYPGTEVFCQDGVYTATGENFTMTVEKGKTYLEINDRYLYVPNGFKTREADGMVMVPARILGQALGFGVDWKKMVLFTSGGTLLLASDKPYTDSDLDLISRVITHESGNQPLEGKMAVGNVILNRVNNSLFPDTVSEVIYQKNQFPGATNATANAESIIAAKLVLEGANVVPDAYYFNGVGKACWASRNKTLLYTIGGHAFYG